MLNGQMVSRAHALCAVRVVENGYVVEFVEPREAKERERGDFLPPTLSRAALSIAAAFAKRAEALGESEDPIVQASQDAVKTDESGSGLAVLPMHSLELVGVFCSNEEAVAKAASRARRAHEQVATLEREGRVLPSAVHGLVAHAHPFGGIGG